jgi:hypothetical protein
MNAVAEPSPANPLWRLEPARWGLSDLLIQTVKKELLASTGNFVGLYQYDPTKLRFVPEVRNLGEAGQRTCAATIHVRNGGFFRVESA